MVLVYHCVCVRWLKFPNTLGKLVLDSVKISLNFDVFLSLKQSCSITGCNGKLTSILKGPDHDGFAADVTAVKCEHVYD